jgi:DNA polymerase III alpha subunit
MQGTIPVTDIIKKGKEYRLPALALTDTNGMYGLVKFVKEALKENIKPLLGTLLTDISDEKISAVVLAKNKEGYAELCKLITLRKLNDDFSLINILNGRSDNLIVLSSSEELINNINSKKNFYIQLNSASSAAAHSRKLFEISRDKEIPAAAATPIYFLEKEDYFLHKVVTAIRLNTTVANLGKAELADEEYYFKDAGSEKDLWKNFPEAVSNTYRISENCNVDLEFNRLKFPEFELPLNTDSHSYLSRIAYEGLYKRYKPVTQQAIDRLEMELGVIRELNFSGYFLVVWDIVNEAKRRGMMIIGRGSAANSIVSYCLFLTGVDPLAHNLYFERFLNRGRSSPPDVDIDFSWKERDEIVRYIFDKYGYERVAFISTTVTFRARSAFRETAKVFGFSDSEISKFSKLIPWTNAKNLPDVPEVFPEARSLNFKIEPWKTIVNYAARLADFPRHLSIHPSGIIITPLPVVNYTALEYAKNKGLGLIITQPDMYSIEDLGLIKIDLLSQRSLGVLRDTMDRLGEEY